MYSHHNATFRTDPIDSENQESLRKLLKGPAIDTWNRGSSNEFGRLLANVIGKNRPANERIKITGTIFPIRRANISKDRKVTYAKFVFNTRLQKTETDHVRMTASGDHFDYPREPISPSVSILDAKNQHDQHHTKDPATWESTSKTSTSAPRRSTNNTPASTIHSYPMKSCTNTN